MPAGFFPQSFLLDMLQLRILQRNITARRNTAVSTLMNTQINQTVQLFAINAVADLEFC